MTLTNIDRLSQALSRINGVKIDCQTDEPYDGKLCVFFTYKDNIATVEQQVRFIDKFARMLGNSEDYAAYAASIEMVWISDKGIDGMNKPFFVIETLPSEIESLTNVILSSINHGVAKPFTLPLGYD